MAEHQAALPAPWEAWLGSSLAQLGATQRLRRQRPLLPTTSPTEVRCCCALDAGTRYSSCGMLLIAKAAKQVLVPSEVLSPWIAEDGQRPAPEAAEEGSVLRMFSSNDYMGLSTHPAVRQAAADAALLYGMGARSRMLAACSIDPVLACHCADHACKPPWTVVMPCLAPFISQNRASSGGLSPIQGLHVRHNSMH